MEMVDVILDGFRKRIEEDIERGAKIHYLDPKMCFAYYDPQMMRRCRYGFYATMGQVPEEDYEWQQMETWAISNSVDQSFEYGGYIPRSDLEHYEEVIHAGLLSLCKEFEGSQV